MCIQWGACVVSLTLTAVARDSTAVLFTRFFFLRQKDFDAESRRYARHCGKRGGVNFLTGKKTD